MLEQKQRPGGEPQKEEPCLRFVNVKMCRSGELYMYVRHCYYNQNPINIINRNRSLSYLDGLLFLDNMSVRQKEAQSISWQHHTSELTMANLVIIPHS